MCVICDTRGCHLSKHQKSGKQLYKKFVRSHLAEDANDDDDEAVASEESSHDVESIEQESYSYISFTRTTVAMGMSSQRTKWIVNGAIIDGGSNTMSSVGLALFPATKTSNMRNIKPLFEKDSNKIAGIGSSTSTLGKIQFFFHFGSMERTVDIRIFPGHTPPVISRMDLDRM